MAFAEPPPDATEAAREHNRAAIESFKAGDYEQALESFERAFELLPDAKVRLNLGVVNENLDRLDEAKGHYEAFLREYPRGEKAPVVREKLAGVEKRMRQWGKLVVQVSPPPDRVRVDQREFRTTPVTVWLPPGRHRVVAEKDGAGSAEQAVEVHAGALGELRLELARTLTTTTDRPTPVAPAPLKAARPAAPAGKAGASPGSFRPVPWALRGVGAALAAGGAAVLLGALAGAATSGSIFAVRVTVPGTDRFTRPMEAGFVGGGAVLVACALLAPLGLLAAVAAVAASFFV
ncbi:MAG: tetratricopeptide repeat protein [Deltaproteobacteria bacterium]|nr:tetratricopeptide repeat protein [Deltaproteobacteria bacterium]